MDAAVGFDGYQFLVLLVGFAVLHAQHGRLAGAVEVGIQHAHARAHTRHGGSEVGGGGGLADAALAGCDGDDVFHAFDGGDAGLHFVRADNGVDAEVDVCIACDADDGLLHPVRQFRADMVDGKAELQGDVEAV